MAIHCISDLHGNKPELGSGELLIVAGDISRTGREAEICDMAKWLEEQEYQEIVVIAGNHDLALEEECMPFYRARYLCNTGAKINGLKIWGTPYVPQYSDWAFMKSEKELEKVWAKLPYDVDIIVAHGPPYGILDKTVDGERAGCKAMKEAVMRSKARLVVFGHIHEGRGMAYRKGWYGQNIKFINASYLNEKYVPYQNAFSVSTLKVPK